FVLGHSWRSVVGVKMVQNQPDLFAAFIGTGQAGNWNRGVRYQKDFVRQKANESGNEEAVRTIDNIEHLDPASAQHFSTGSRPQRGYLGKYFNAIRHHPKSSSSSRGRVISVGYTSERLSEDPSSDRPRNAGSPGARYR